MAGAPARAARLAIWRRIDARRLFLGDLPLKAAAIGVALLLFVASVRAAPAEVTVQLEGRVPVERPDVPAGYVFRAQLGDVGIRLRGPEGIVSSIGPQQLRATIDLTTVTPGPDAQEAQVVVEVPDQRVSVVEISPATVTVRLERRATRVFAVQAKLANAPPAGYRASPATFRPQEVSVSGPESAVSAVAAVLATVRFGDAAVDLAQDVRPEPVDATGAPIEGLEADPVAVRVTLPLLPSATTRTVPISWRIRGAVAAGYWISRVDTDPVAVTLSGDPKALEAVGQVETNEIDVSGLTHGQTTVATLSLPAGVSLLGATEVRVTLTVVVLSGTRSFQSAVAAVGVGTGLSAHVESGSVDVVLAGTLPVLGPLGAGAVTARVDVSGRAAGTYVLEVLVSAPSGTTVQSVRPGSVTVTITDVRPSPTP